MRGHRAGNATRDLRNEIETERDDRQFSCHQEDERYRWIEMRSRDRPQRCDQNDQDGAGRDRVAEQGDRCVATRQVLGHDPGTDDCRDQ
jgi:hypothetical protein